ncbi:MAG TPA: AAA family ATPase, partial [Polyangia bacterium]
MAPKKKPSKDSRLRDEEGPREDRVTRIWAKGLRSLRDVDLRLGNLTVLIGENGSGKSSLIEVIEILRRTSSTSFKEELNAVHGGLTALLRKGERRMTVGLEIEGREAPCRYEFTVEHDGFQPKIVHELVRVLPRHHPPSDGDVKLLRDEFSATFFDMQSVKQVTIQPIDSTNLMLPRLGNSPLQLDLARVVNVLETIDVQVPFDVSARWVSRATGRPSLAREPVTIQPAASLQLLGRNLPNAFHELKNHMAIAWTDTLELVRLGLGPDLDDV